MCVRACARVCVCVRARARVCVCIQSSIFNVNNYRLPKRHKAVGLLGVPVQGTVM